jgi:hypothetical protein
MASFSFVSDGCGCRVEYWHRRIDNARGASMGHQHGHGHRLEHGARYSTQNEVAKSGMRIGSHDDQVDA